MLLEDLGDDLYTDVLAQGGDEDALYGAAIDALGAPACEPRARLARLRQALYAYDDTPCLAETDLLTEWFMPAGPRARLRTPDETGAPRIVARRARVQSARSRGLRPSRLSCAEFVVAAADESGAAARRHDRFPGCGRRQPAYDLISLLEDARRDVAPELARRHDEALSRRHEGAAGPSSMQECVRAEMAVIGRPAQRQDRRHFRASVASATASRAISPICRAYGAISSAISGIPRSPALKAWYDRGHPRERRGVRIEGLMAP